tara:strand:+ start:490 stop:1038 length:549 start_codon:yes stop_codon:yes gene_type:complete
MANGTLKVSNIETSSGSGTITLGQSGETVTIASGATQTIAVNTPSFLVSNTANNTGKSDNTYAKMTYNVETYDTAGAFDISNNKFTVPTGEAGKYFFSVTEFLVGDSAGCNDSWVNFYKNGSSGVAQGGNDFDFSNYSPTFSAVLDLAAGDYIEVYCKVNTDSGNWGQYAGGIWQGYKIIGA